MKTFPSTKLQKDILHDCFLQLQNTYIIMYPICDIILLLNNLWEISALSAFTTLTSCRNKQDPTER